MADDPLPILRNCEAIRREIAVLWEAGRSPDLGVTAPLRRLGQSKPNLCCRLMGSKANRKAHWRH